MENVIQNPTHQIYNTNPNPRKKNNITKFVFLYIFGFFIAIIVTILILNYFKILDLYTIPPFSYIQKQTSDQQEYLNNYKIQNTNKYALKGKLINFSKNSITLKPKNYNPITISYNINSKFYSYKIAANATEANNKLSITPTPSAELIPTVEFPENLLNKNNIGKDMFAHFIIINNKYILQELDINE